MATTNITVLDDAWVSSAAADTNYGNSTPLGIRSSGAVRRALCHLDLSTFTPYCTINQALMYIYVETGSGTGDINIHPATQAWVQSTVTYNNMPTIGSAIGVGVGNPGGFPCWVSMDVTTWAQAAVAAGTNLGLVMKFLTEGGGSDWCGVSSFEDATNKPYLYVDYTEATVPAAVDDLSATGGLNKIDLAWTAPDDGGAPITDYDIYRSLTTGTEIYIDSVGSDATAFEDSTVDDGVAYFYKIIAVNSIGDSDLSNEDSAASFGLPGAPTALDSDSHASTSVNLTWTAPASTGGSPITNYRVYKGTITGVLTAVGYVGSDATSYNVINLVQGTTYFFAVAAVTAVGEGDQSSETSEYPSVPPGAPTGLTSAIQDEHADLTWSAPASTGGSPITGYKLYIGVVLVHTIGTPTTSFTDTGLTNGTTYTYTVKATNRDGDSPASDAFSYTPGAVPSAPTSPAIVACRKRLYLYWTAPSNNGYAISAYNIYKGTASGSLTLLGTTTDTYYSDTASTLVPGTEYYYKISASNTLGEGSQSTELHESLLIPVRGIGVYFQELGYLEVKTGYDKATQPTYSHTRPIDCRVSYKKTSIKGPNLEVVMSKVQVWVDGTITCSPGDRVTLPSGEIRMVLTVERKVDPKATVLAQVMFT